jgi:hypothetical protein
LRPGVGVHSASTSRLFSQVGSVDIEDEG